MAKSPRTERSGAAAIGTVSRAGLVALKRLRGSGQDHDDISRLTGETECL